MASNYNFTVNKSQIITKALQIIGALPEGQTPTELQKTDAGLMLSMLNASYRAEGLVSWLQETYVLFTDRNKGRYHLDSDYGNQWSTEGGVIWSTLATSMLAGDTSVTLTAEPSSPFKVNDMSSLYDVGIRLDNGEFHFSKMVTYSGPTSFALLDSLPSAAAAGNRVYCTQGTAPRPSRIAQVYRSTDSDISSPLSYLSIEDYQALSNKAQLGVPNSYSYINRKDYTRFYLWPVPDKGYRISILSESDYTDLDNDNDIPGVAKEMYLVMVWELAAMLAVEYGVDTRMINMIKRTAMQYKEVALSFADQSSYIKLEPDTRYGGYY